MYDKENIDIYFIILFALYRRLQTLSTQYIQGIIKDNHDTEEHIDGFCSHITNKITDTKNNNIANGHIIKTTIRGYIREKLT